MTTTCSSAVSSRAMQEHLRQLVVVLDEAGTRSRSAGGRRPLGWPRSSRRRERSPSVRPGWPGRRCATQDGCRRGSPPGRRPAARAPEGPGRPRPPPARNPAHVIACQPAAVDQRRAGRLLAGPDPVPEDVDDRGARDPQVAGDAVDQTGLFGSRLTSHRLLLALANCRSIASGWARSIGSTRAEGPCSVLHGRSRSTPPAESVGLQLWRSPHPDASLAHANPFTAAAAGWGSLRTGPSSLAPAAPRAQPWTVRHLGARPAEDERGQP